MRQIIKSTLLVLSIEFGYDYMHYNLTFWKQGLLLLTFIMAVNIYVVVVAEKRPAMPAGQR